VGVLAQQDGASGRSPAGPPALLRRIWLCADDYGIAPGVSSAIRELIARGRLNATSVMVAAPSFDRQDAVSLAILNSGSRRMAIGLHLTLTAPFGPLSEDYAPLRDGEFLSLPATMQAAALHRLKPEKLAGETEMQIDKFIEAFGRPPDFIDGHQHVHLFAQVRDAVLAVAKERAPNAWLRQCGRGSFRGVNLRDRKALLLDLLSRSFRRRARRLGLQTNPAFAGAYAFTDDADFAKLFPTFLDGLPDGGVVMCHPGHVDAELRRLDPLTTLREYEYAYLAGEEFPQVLEERGVTLA
jgi:chitin disaccharide deacetylase